MGQVKIDTVNYADIISLASEKIKNAEIVAYPTETFYGLGVRYDDEKALMRLYGIKKRPEDKTMPLIIGNLTQLEVLTESINEIERLLIDEFWHGPLTILFNAKKGLSEFIVKNGKVAVRLPDNQIARDISFYSNMPITSTSANISFMPPPQDVETVSRYFGDSIDLIIDGGQTRGGMPSTIVEVKDNKIFVIRRGAIDMEVFCRRVGLGLQRND